MAYDRQNKTARERYPYGDAEERIKPGMSGERVISEIIELERRKELAQEVEEFQEDLHQVPAGTPAQVGESSITQTAAKTEFLLQLENIMADGLGDIYMGLELGLRDKFRRRGEEVAQKIEEMIVRGKMKMKKILAWIRAWLKMIPGINKFFLEQEAKIKTDKIIQMISHHS